jgi:hypothetical protein
LRFARHRRAQAHNREIDLRKCAQLLNGFQARAQVFNLGHRECRVHLLQAWRALTDVEQPVFIAIGERAQQHGAHHAEDGGIGANSQSQREGNGDPKRLNAR